MPNIPVLHAVYEEAVRHFPSHNHNCSQLIYLSRGSVSLHVGDIAYLATAPAVIIIGRMEEHTISPVGDSYQRYCVNVSSLGESTEEPDPLITFLSRRPEGFCHVLDVSGYREETASLFSAMAEECKNQNPFYERKIELLFYQLLILIYRHAPEMFSAVSQKSTETVWLIQRELEESYQNSISLETLASKYHLNESYLSHLFKETTGYSVYQYLLMCRLSAAKNLLTDSKISITDIADRVGFTDSSNFSRLFRKRFGISPGQFRKMNR